MYTHLCRIRNKQHDVLLVLSFSKKVTQSLGHTSSLHPAELKISVWHTEQVGMLMVRLVIKYPLTEYYLAAPSQLRDQVQLKVFVEDAVVQSSVCLQQQPDGHSYIPLPTTLFLVMCLASQ